MADKSEGRKIGKHHFRPLENEPEGRHERPKHLAQELPELSPAKPEPPEERKTVVIHETGEDDSNKK